MEKSYTDFFQSCASVSNCQIVCQNNKIISSHKIVLALCGELIKNLLREVPDGDDVTIFLPDFDHQEIESLIQDQLLHKSGGKVLLGNIFGYKHQDHHPPDLLKVKIEEEKKQINETDNVTLDEEQLTPATDEENEKLSEKNKISKLKHCLRKSDYEPRNVDFDKLREKLIINPQTREDKKHNEIIEKQILHERAIEAYLSGDSSLNQIGQQFGVKKSTLYKLLKCDKKFSGRGNKSSLFSEDEEKLITDKALSLVSSGKNINLGILRELLTEEIKNLRVAHPERKFNVGLSSKDGEAINKSFVRRFAIRNKLEKFMFQKYVLSEKRKYECDICSKTFTLKCSLATHQKQIHFSFLQNNDLPF